MLQLKKSAIWRMQCFFWCYLSTTVCKFNNFNGKVNAIQRSMCSCTKRASKLKVCFYWRFCGKFILSLAFICVQSSFLVQHGKKAIMTYIILLYFFLLLKGTSIQDNNICPVPSSACFRRFHDYPLYLGTI